MRHINIAEVVGAIPADVITELEEKYQETVLGNDDARQMVIDNGNAIWRKIKGYLEGVSNRKCWYTESKNPGCLNDVDHFRPKGKRLDDNDEIVHWYWFLAFDPSNYRLSCQFPNRPNINPQTGQTGGKGVKFPLLGGQAHATKRSEIAQENPVLLDPCSLADCGLLEFQADGRPVITTIQRNNAVACYRVIQSNLLLNLDYPTFNEDREQLYNKIKMLVERGDRYGTASPALHDVKEDLKALIDPKMEYSKAAECYVRCFRDREWVEQLFHN